MNVLDSVMRIFFKCLMWMFFVGMAGCALTVIPLTAFNLFKVLFERDDRDEQ